ncbi:hypothetical protein TRIUR3_26271 [Triticum urartu]|uniref:Uncharacterized protein n=1 Tax=Triticum urartu TaxID=4572 RepID=M7YYJ9_TRIUA|nr:hypothetical protein TRIUR3_26271 [Triticum urartu]
MEVGDDTPNGCGYGRCCALLIPDAIERVDERRTEMPEDDAVLFSYQIQWRMAAWSSRGRLRCATKDGDTELDRTKPVIFVIKQAPWRMEVWSSKDSVAVSQRMAIRSPPRRRPSLTSSRRCRGGRRRGARGTTPPVSLPHQDGGHDPEPMKMTHAPHAARNTEPTIRRRWCYAMTRLHRPLPRSRNVFPLSWWTTEYGVQPRRSALFMAYRSRHTGSMLLVLADHRIRHLA